MLRVPPETHRRLAVDADLSLNRLPSPNWHSSNAKRKCPRIVVVDYSVYAPVPFIVLLGLVLASFRFPCLMAIIATGVVFSKQSHP
jgi:hypothetical protein